jgi:predicted ATPase
MADFDLAATFIPSLHKPASLLPIARHKKSLLYTIETYPVTIVVGQTGSGKTTQIPQYLEQAGWCADGKTIAVTQVGSSSNHIATDHLLIRVAAPRSGNNCRDQSRRRDGMQNRRRGGLFDQI